MLDLHLASVSTSIPNIQLARHCSLLLNKDSLDSFKFLVIFALRSSIISHWMRPAPEDYGPPRHSSNALSPPAEQSWQELLPVWLTKCGLQDCKTGKFSYSSLLVMLAIICALLPLTINQLTLAIFIAVAFALHQEYCRSHGERQKPCKASVVNEHQERQVPNVLSAVSLPLEACSPCTPRLVKPSSHEMLCQLGTPPGLDLPTAAQPLHPACGTERPASQSGEPPIAELNLPGKFDSEVDALLRVISPTPASDRMVKELARQVQQTIRPTFPDSEVIGFSTGDLACNASLGMATPEVDLVVNINPVDLPGQLLSRIARTGGASTAKLDAWKVQKSALRACTNRLVSDGGFKFRRSAFTGQEPKVTLLAPAPLGKSIGDDSAGIPVDLSVNSATPQCTDAVLKACRSFDPRAQALLVLVRRWARDRGICHSAKGHLSPYSWSLLAAFYLQVAPAGQTPPVPPLSGVKLGSGGFSMQQTQSKPASADSVEWSPAGGVDYGSSSALQKKSVAALFQDFVLFYHKDFNWRSEAVSLRAGRRAAPELALPLHIVVSSSGIPTQVGPHIEDPFQPTTNLGKSMTEEGFARMHEEFARALNILTRSSPEPSVAELLQLWVAPHPPNDAEGESGSMTASQRSADFLRSPSSSPISSKFVSSSKRSSGSSVATTVGTDSSGVASWHLRR